MTVHSAKGLEFFAVFITGLEEALFPHENSLNELDGLEEERRRRTSRSRVRGDGSTSRFGAQSRLLHGQMRYGIKSRFLQELPDAAVKWLTPRQPVGGGGRFGQWHDAGVGPQSQACCQPGLLRMECASASRCVTRASATVS